MWCRAECRPCGIAQSRSWLMTDYCETGSRSALGVYYSPWNAFKGWLTPDCNLLQEAARIRRRKKRRAASFTRFFVSGEQSRSREHGDHWLLLNLFFFLVKLNTGAMQHVSCRTVNHRGRVQEWGMFSLCLIQSNNGSLVLTNPINFIELWYT